MKKTIFFLLSSFLLPVFMKQAIAQDISFEKNALIEKQVDSAFHSMIKAAESLEYSTLNNGVDDLHKAGFIINNSYFPEFDSLLANLKARSQGVAGQTITIQAEKITVLSETIVLLTAYGNAQLATMGGDSISTKFFWSFVYEKIKGSWKVIQSQQSGYR